MEELDVTRLPHNIEAEQVLIGALLANNKAYEKVSEFLKPEHFSDPMHAKVFNVMARLIQKGHVADVITLKNYFEQEGTLNEVGGIAYLIKLAESSTPAVNIAFPANICKLRLPFLIFFITHPPLISQPLRPYQG